MLRASLITLLAATAFNGCIYANYRSPVSYRSPTPSDVPGPLGPEVEGESCNKLVLWLVAWGDAAYSAAVDAAKAKSGASMLADVQVDNRVYNVLGVYQKSCTRIALQSTRRAPRCQRALHCSTCAQTCILVCSCSCTANSVWS